MNRRVKLYSLCDLKCKLRSCLNFKISNRMKKLILTTLGIVLFSSLVSAQPYIRTGLGYALPLASESIGEETIESDVFNGNTNTSTSTTKNVNASYGAGFTFNIGAGYMFSEYLGIDVAVSYLVGKKHETSNIYTYKDNNISGKDEYISTTRSNGIFITPSLVITSGGANAPYGRFGIITGSPKIMEDNSYYYDLDGTSTSSSEAKYKGGLAMGFQGAVGMKWTIADNIKLYTELNFISMSYSPKKRILTEFINNGQDNFGQLSVYAKETEYVKTIDNTEMIDTTQPRQELRDSKPFSSVSFQVGIVYSIGEKSM